MRSIPVERRLLRGATYAGALGIPGWIFWCLTRGMLGNPIGYDEQYFMWGGWCVLKGLAPYRDFLEFKPPMTFLSHAAAIKLFGYENERFRYFFFWLAFSSVLALVASLIKRGADAVLTIALSIGMIYFFVHPGYHEAFLADTESIGLSFYLWGVAFLIAKTEHRKAAEIIGAMFLACSGLSKEPFIPCVLGTWVSCYFLVYGEVSRRRVLAYLKYTTIGVAIVFGVLSAYMIPTGAMTAYIETVGRYFTMFRDYRTGYCVLIGMFQPTGKGFWADLPRQIARLRQDFFNPATLNCLLPFVVMTIVATWRRSRVLLVCSTITVALAGYGLTASHCYFSHYYLIAQAGLFFFLAVGVDSVGSRLASCPRDLRILIQSAFLLSTFFEVWPRLSPPPRAAVLVNRPLLEPTTGLFEFIRTNSKPEDKIFTTGPPSLYVYTDRVGAVRESALIDELVPAMPGETDTDKLRPIYDQLVRNQPKVVFLDPEHGHRKYRHLNGAIMPFLTEFKYTKVNDRLYLRSD